jgi:hypothetical protein
MFEDYLSCVGLTCGYVAKCKQVHEGGVMILEFFFFFFLAFVLILLMRTN